jgi:ribosome biogenesis GTPase
MGEAAPRVGLVTRLQANRPTVRLDDGAEWLCHLRGRIRHTYGRILVGDRVLVSPTDPGQGRIEDVLARGVTLPRPPVTNVTGVVVAFSVRHPAGSEDLLDRRLVLARLYGLDVLIVATKADLVPTRDRARLDTWARWYPVIWTSVRSGEGLDALVNGLRSGIWVLTGESGAGKSSLVQALVPDAEVLVDDLSRIERGRQTTRTVTLYPVGRAWLADTPGFTQLDLPTVGVDAVRDAFPEWQGASCRFPDCRHRGEAGCAVPDLLRRGDVAAVRYRHYVALADEVARRDPRR